MITKLGKQKLEQRIVELKEELRRTYQQRSEAAAEGDLKENSAYIFAGERANVLNSQIEDAVAELKESVVQTAPTQNKKVAFGHRVTLRFENDKRQLIITLVGKNDARLKPDWISIDSPLGLAIINRKLLDTVMVNDQPVTILEITVGDI